MYGELQWTSVNFLRTRTNYPTWLDARYLEPAKIFLFWGPIILRIDPGFFMVPCCGRPWWTTAYQTCMRCLMQALEATRCRAVGNTACTQVRDPATDTVNPNHCTIHPAWSRLGPPANITRARIQLVLLCLRASFAAWRSLSVISTISLSITLRSNLTFHTCSGCRVLTRKVWRLDCDFFHLFGLGGWLWKGWVACIPLNWLTSFIKCLLHLFERLSLWNVCEEHLCFSVLFFVC